MLSLSFVPSHSQQLLRSLAARIRHAASPSTHHQAVSRITQHYTYTPASQPHSLLELLERLVSNVAATITAIDPDDDRRSRGDGLLRCVEREREPAT